MAQLLSLAGILCITWLLLSGIDYSGLMLALGLMSVTIVVAISAKLRLVDREGQPFDILPRLVTAWTWLLIEIMKASFDVSRRMLMPTPDISPTLVRVPFRLHEDDLARVTYANWITLTPGTVSITVEPDAVLVHALTRGGAGDLATGEMEKRVIALTRGRSD